MEGGVICHLYHMERVPGKQTTYGEWLNLTCFFQPMICCILLFWILLSKMSYERTLADLLRIRVRDQRQCNRRDKICFYTGTTCSSFTANCLTLPTQNHSLRFVVVTVTFNSSDSCFLHQISTPGKIIFKNLSGKTSI